MDPARRWPAIFLHSIDPLAQTATVFDEKCIRGLEGDGERMRDTASRSPALGTTLVPAIGYDEAACLVSLATERRCSLAEMAASEGIEIAGSLDLRLAHNR